jgi:hypothetical protein
MLQIRAEVRRVIEAQALFHSIGLEDVRLAAFCLHCSAHVVVVAML